MAPPRLTSEEIKLRGTLLSGNKELLQLHRTLVRSNLITEEEFWQSRLPLLKSQEALIQQQRPIPSALAGSSDVALRDAGGRTAAPQQKIIFTPETIESILRQNPNLLRAHSDFVPGKMSEKEFWTLYVQSRFFQQLSPASPADDAAATSASNNPLDAYWQRDESGDDADQAWTARGAADAPRVSRGIDVVATAEDHFSDYGNRTAQHLKSQEGDRSLSLIKRFNNHSLKVVQRSLGRSLPPVRIEDSISLEDLTTPPERACQTITARREGPPAAVAEGGSLAGAAAENEKGRRHFLQELSQLEPDIREFIGAHARTHQDRHAILSKFVFKCAAPRGSASSAAATPPQLPPALTNLAGSDIMTFHGNAAEVLRHFWLAYPPGKDANRQAKVYRMRTIMEQLLKKGKELVASRGSPKDQVVVESALSPLMGALEHALSQAAPTSP